MQGSLTNSAGGVVKASQGRLLSAVLAGGSAASTLIIYDNATEAAGTVLLKLCALIGGSASVVFTDMTARLAANGLYAALSGEGAVATIGYE